VPFSHPVGDVLKHHDIELPFFSTCCDIAVKQIEARILVIDDEEIIRNVARDILHELGYDTILASSGKEGVKIYADKKDFIDLVILDMIMPEMEGKETFKKLKEINPDVKILISSGYNQDSLPEQVMDSGEAGFIQKPYNINEIAEIIKEVLYTA